MVHKKHLKKIAKGLRERVWDRNLRLQAASVFAEVAYELNPEFDSFKFYEACGLVDENNRVA
jgi:hypothetical protein